jgi:tetratricopeptide (TPR) repeat protein
LNLKITSVNRGTLIVIFIMTVLAVAGIIFARSYYGNINRSVDPRVKPAKVLYGQYNLYASENHHDKIFALLDSIGEIYAAVPHYRNSYEKGVIENNRASVYLMMALSDSLNKEFRGIYFELAEKHLLAGIEFYDRWLDFFGNLSMEEILAIVEYEFRNDEILSGNEYLDAIIKNRVKEIQTAQFETKRRLSVSYTNLGIIRRHENNLEEAYGYYTQALDMWTENHAAKNNINILFGRPVEKQSILKKLFPPERN